MDVHAEFHTVHLNRYKKAMSMESSQKNSFSKSDDTLKLYGYRWVVISVYALYAAINIAQFGQFTIVMDIVEKYYGVSLATANMSGEIFMILNIVLFIPTGHLVERWSLKTTSIVCTGLTALGNCMKFLACSPDRYFMVLITQSICAVAQNIVLIIPSKIACAWFGPEEVSFACSIGLFGTQIGSAVGALVPPFIVKDHDDLDMISDDFNTLFIYNSAVSVAIFVLTILAFRSKPPSPPSKSQLDLKKIKEEDEMTYWKALKLYSKNRDFIVILCTLGLAYGQWNFFVVMISPMISEAFPDEDNTLAGILSSVATIAGGCFGSIIFGYILDKTHKYKLVSFVVLLCNLIFTIAEVIALLMSNKIATCITIGLYGFFSGSLMVISYEYTTEVTYPIPEAFGGAILNVVIYIFAILYVQVLTLVFNSAGYLTGYCIMIVSLVIATFPILLMSSELKRRDANVGMHVKCGV